MPRTGVVIDASVATLLGLYGEILNELRERGVVRTGNAAVGDDAEWLIASAAAADGPALCAGAATSPLV